ncbi:MAG: hypothetical protein WAO08_26005 [Hyphomicrobiaceae bacterium]
MTPIIPAPMTPIVFAARDCHVRLCRLPTKRADFTYRSGQDKVACLGAIAPIRTVEVGHE